jgi:hypothetical protein
MMSASAVASASALLYSRNLEGAERRTSARVHGLFEFVGDSCNAVGSTCLVPVAARGTADAKAADDFRTVLDGNASRIGKDTRQIRELWSSAVGRFLDERSELARAREAEDRAHGDDCIGLSIGRVFGMDRCMITTKLDDDETGRVDDRGSDIPTVGGARINRSFGGFQRHLHRKVVSVDVDLRECGR